MLRFPYLEEPLLGPAPPSLPARSTSRWRPLLPVRIIGPTGQSRLFLRALLDPGADDTIFPSDVAAILNVPLRGSGKHSIRWRGQRYSLDFGDCELELSDGASSWRWSAVLGFSSAPIRYPLLGIAGCLQFMDARFLGQQRAVEIDANAAYPGPKSQPDPGSPHVEA